jgi:hypothetical protein
MFSRNPHTPRIPCTAPPPITWSAPHARCRLSAPPLTPRACCHQSGGRRARLRFRVRPGRAEAPRRDDLGGGLMQHGGAAGRGGAGWAGRVGGWAAQAAVGAPGARVRGRPLCRRGRRALPRRCGAHLVHAPLPSRTLVATLYPSGRPTNNIPHSHPTPTSCRPVQTPPTPTPLPTPSLTPHARFPDPASLHRPVPLPLPPTSRRAPLPSSNPPPPGEEGRKALFLFSFLPKVLFFRKEGE